jgi:hypothetical protein
MGYSPPRSVESGCKPHSLEGSAPSPLEGYCQGKAADIHRVGNSERMCRGSASTLS